MASGVLWLPPTLILQNEHFQVYRHCAGSPWRGPRLTCRAGTQRWCCNLRHRTTPSPLPTDWTPFTCCLRDAPLPDHWRWKVSRQYNPWAHPRPSASLSPALTACPLLCFTSPSWPGITEAVNTQCLPPALLLHLCPIKCYFVDFSSHICPC